MMDCCLSLGLKPVFFSSLLWASEVIKLLCDDERGSDLELLGLPSAVESTGPSAFRLPR